MLSVLPIWFVVWAVCIGLGAAFAWIARRVGGSAFARPLDTFQVFWTGLAILIGILEFFSVAFPINGGSWFVVVPIAVVGWVTTAPGSLRRLRARFRRGLIIRRVAEAIALAVIVFVVADRSIQPVTWWDTLTTHLSQAKWVHEFRAPPGLGNLYSKLAFDSSENLLAAFMEIGPWRDRSVHLLNGFLMACVLLTWLRGVTRPATTLAAWSSRAFRILVTGYLIEKLCSPEIPSLSTDLAMALVALIALADLLRVSTRSGTQVAALLATAAVCVSFKVSGLPILVCVVPVAIAFLLRQRRRQPLRSAILLSVIPVLVVAGLELRRVILTGWLFYPAPMGNLHLPWSMKRSIVVDTYEWIKSWARLPRVAKSDVLSRPFLGWFVPWFDRFRTSHEFSWLCYGSLVLLVRHTSATCRRILPRAPLAETCAVAGAASALVYWFIVAPDLRFGGVFFWSYAAAAAAVPLALVARSGLAGRAILAVAGAIWITVGGFNITQDSTLTKFVPAAPVFSTYVQLIDTTAVPPLEVHIANDNYCGNAPLPCIERRLEGARWRKPGHLESGFLP